MTLRKLAALAVATLGLSMTAQGAVIVTLLEQDGNLVATATGTLNLDGLTSQYTDGADPFLWPAYSGFGVGAPMSYGDARAYAGDFSGPEAFGSANQFFWASGSGVGFNFVPIDGLLLVPVTFTSGDAINATNTWENTTFADLGATPGSYVWTWSSDSITLQIGPAETATPEPASFALVGGAVAVLAYVRRKRG